MKRAGLLGLLVLLAPSACERVTLVNDGAHLLTDEQTANLVLHHQFLQIDHDIDYRVVTLTGTENIDIAANELFEKISAGSQSARGRGLLLLLDPDLQEVRLEVGYSLEGTFPDAFVAYVEQRQMVPFFVAGRISDGILASTELIIDRAQKASQNASWDDEIWMAGSGGAGASASTRTAPAYRTTAPGAESPVLTQTSLSPEDVVDAYLDAMRRRDANPELDIYTPETRHMLRGRVVTPAQMDQVARAYASCGQPRLIRSGEDDLAVARYPIAQRACAPWFLQRSTAGWQLDLTMMQTAIRFGRSNAWHFDLSASHPYEFAFDDWEFDVNGFPVRASRAE